MFYYQRHGEFFAQVAGGLEDVSCFLYSAQTVVDHQEP